VQAASRQTHDDSDDGDASDADTPAAPAVDEPRPASPCVIDKLTTRCCRLCNKGSCYDDCKWYTPACAHSFHGKNLRTRGSVLTFCEIFLAIEECLDNYIDKQESFPFKCPICGHSFKRPVVRSFKVILVVHSFLSLICLALINTLKSIEK
jgi:hypothetical protein